MDKAFIISQLLGFIVLVVSVVGLQFKKMEWIAVTGFVGNGLNSVSYVLLNGISGSYISIVAAIQAVFAFVYAKKDKTGPKWTVCCFMAVYILLSLFTYKSISDILPGIGVIMYCLAIMQKESSNYRKYMLVNASVWIVYNIVVSAYVMIIAQVMSLISVIIGMIRYDTK